MLVPPAPIASRARVRSSAPARAVSSTRTAPAVAPQQLRDPGRDPVVHRVQALHALRHPRCVGVQLDAQPGPAGVQLDGGTHQGAHRGLPIRGQRAGR